MFNPFPTDDTPVCGRKFEPADKITIYIVPMNISSRLSSNSEADASELLECSEEMFSL